MSQTKKKRKTNGKSIIVSVAAVLLIIYLVFSIVSAVVETKEKKRELAELSTQLEQQNEKNSELASAVDNSDEKALAEKYARENGYAYPDERLYYDATPGEQN